jgi:F-type H+-transporting ATPase subunit gamma
MSSLREMRLHIRSVQNIGQVTRALQTVSASKVRRAQASLLSTRPYAQKALELLEHLANRRNVILHPMLNPRAAVRDILIILVSGDRGLAGAYNANVVRKVLQQFSNPPAPVHYIPVGRKGREILLRMGARISAEFSNLPPAPAFNDTSAVGRLAVEEYLSGKADEVYIAYTVFRSMVEQHTSIRLLLPIAVEEREPKSSGPIPTYIFEPGQSALLDQIIPRLIAGQIYECILESSASEHAARMITMKNATDNAQELTGGLRIEYNKARQQSITGDLLDIAAGAEALAAQSAARA